MQANERLGGLVSVASLAGFYAWMTAMGRFPGGPYFLVAAAPGFLFLVAGVMAGAGDGKGRGLAEPESRV